MLEACLCSTITLLNELQRVLFALIALSLTLFQTSAKNDFTVKVTAKTLITALMNKGGKLIARHSPGHSE